MASETGDASYSPSSNYTAFDHSGATTKTGNPASNVGARGEFRVLSAAGDVTDPAVPTADHISVMVALVES